MYDIFHLEIVKFDIIKIILNKFLDIKYRLKVSSFYRTIVTIYHKFYFLLKKQRIFYIYYSLSIVERRKGYN